jgi:hypothetical protein
LSLYFFCPFAINCDIPEWFWAMFIPASEIQACSFAGAVKDSVVGEERIAKYLLSILNTRKTPLHWEKLVNRSDQDKHQVTGTSVRNSILRKQPKHIDGSDVVYIHVGNFPKTFQNNKTELFI